MSKKDDKKIALPEDGSVKTALTTIRATDKGPNLFLVLGYSDANTLAVIGEGEGGLDEAAKHLTDADSRYILLRKDHKVEMAKTIKFAFIDWQPKDVKAMRRTVVSGHRQQVIDLFKPIHVNVQASDRSDLDEKDIMKQIGMNSGTNSAITDKTATKPQTTTVHKKEEKKDGDKKEERPKSQSVSKPVNSGTSTGNIVVDNDTEFKAELKNIRNDKSEINWVLTSYVKKDTLHMISSGTGGVAELAGKIEDDGIFFGLVRVNEIVDNKSKTTKFVLIKSQPENTPPMKKAEVNVKDNSIQQLFAPFLTVFQVAKKDEVTEVAVMDKVGTASGTKSNVKK